MEPTFEFNPEKNEWLKKERGISFEKVILLIAEGCLLDIVEHPNQEKHPQQELYVVDVDGYVYLVPFVKKGETIFLKTIYASRKATKKYLREREGSS